MDKELQVAQLLIPAEVQVERWRFEGTKEAQTEAQSSKDTALQTELEVTDDFACQTELQMPGDIQPALGLSDRPEAELKPISHHMSMMALEPPGGLHLVEEEKADRRRSRAKDKDPNEIFFHMVQML